jgi:acetyl esterase/lipase/GNAT superfamily N-acetyltransferase
MIEIKPGDSSHAEVVAAIIQKSYVEQARILNMDQAQYPNYAAFETPERVRESLAKGDHLLMAFLDNEIIGTVRYSLDPKQGNKGYISRLAVLPEYRGHCYGELLMKSAEDRMLSLAVTRIELSIVADFKKLQRFYEKQGYNPGEIKTFSSLPFLVLFMEKEIASPEYLRDASIYRDLTYVTNGNTRQRLDLYLPRPEHPAPSPLIIWVHGGAWWEGSKEDYLPLDYLRLGYAVASINYRLSQHAVFPAQLEDCKAAVRWLRAHAKEYHFDPDRIGAQGASAGGHLVALLGTTGEISKFDAGSYLNVSSRVQAVVDFFGPTDFLQMDAHRPSDGQTHDTPASPESKLIGGWIQDYPERVAAANPITYITPNAAPFLIIHGDRDPLVPHHQSELLKSALEESGVPVTLYTVKGAGHGGFADPNAGLLTQKFFDKYLKD